ncbi:MAG: hypothetical protein K2Q26_14125 [Bdellovibrionales bacterium]|nr:hypothetical protein [Bdellovibrionales bacterium]
MARPQYNKGFSLASVMVGVAIVGIVAVGTLSLFENMTKSQNMADFRTQRDVLVEEIRAHLSDTQACRATFGSISLLTNGHTEAITQIRNADNSVKWMTATPYSSNTYRISNLVFNYTPGTTATNPSTATANLMVQLQAIKKVAGINVSDPKFINISIKRNPTTGAMLECIASAKMSDGIWQRSNNVNDIFYASGNVGVGSALPQSTFEIYRTGTSPKLTIWNPEEQSVFFEMAGTGGVGGAEGFEIEYTNSGDTYFRNRWNNGILGNMYFQTSTSIGTLQRPLTLTWDGNVGVGTTTPQTKLEVAGEMKIQSTGAPCSPTIEGSIRYIAATKIFEGCNGTAWIPLGGGNPGGLCPPGYRDYGSITASGEKVCAVDPGSSCFTSTTKIRMQDGTNRSIAEVVPGQQVASASGFGNQVIAVEKVLLAQRPLVGFNDEEPFFTPEHPFQTKQGWKSFWPEETYREHGFRVQDILKVGDQVLKDGQWIAVDSVRSQSGLSFQVVYNLVLDGDHTYWANGYLVHNKH